ncbi:MAG: acylphosphatase [Candidatus Promineifilaceae bacterium]
MKRVSAQISGRVQGVSYRYFALNQARRLSLSGWVRNEADGSVSLVAEGEQEALEALLDRLRQGPPAAWVADVRVQWSVASREFDGFQVKFR